MIRWFIMLLTVPVVVVWPGNLFSQTEPMEKEFGITTGAMTNFPANEDYMTDYLNILYIAPYVRAGQHEFSAGITVPLSHHGLSDPAKDLQPRPGATAGYRFYIFDIYGRENLFIHYAFQYLMFKGTDDAWLNWTGQPTSLTETDIYINNIIGLGYNLFFDTQERFALFYTLDYVISQSGYRLSTPASNNDSWVTRYIWNNLSTHVGISIKLAPIKKKDKTNP